MTNWKPVHDLAARTHEVYRITDAATVGEGVGVAGIRAHLRANPHLVVGRNVARTGTNSTPHGRLAEAVLLVDGLCAISGHAALWLHGLWRSPPRPPQVVIPHDRRLSDRPEYVLRRDRHFLDEYVVTRDGLPVLDVPCTIADLAIEGADMVPVALTASQRGVLHLGDLAAHYRRRGSRFPGRPALRELIEALSVDGSESILEQRGRQVLTDAGVRLHPHPMPWRTREGIVVHPDAVCLDAAVAIEFDGFGTHAMTGPFDLDRERWSELNEAFEPVMVTSSQLRTDPARVVARVRRAMERCTKPAPTFAVCSCRGCSGHRTAGCTCPACRPAAPPPGAAS